MKGKGRIILIKSKVNWDNQPLFFQGAATPARVPSTPGQKRIPLCIVTPSTQRKDKRSLNDPTDFTYNELVDIVKELTEKVKKERKEKAKLEKNVREEMTGEYTMMMDEIKECHRAELEETRETLQQTMEQRLDNLTRTTEKHRKRRKLNDENESSASSTYNNSSVSIAAFDEIKAELEQYKVHIHAVEGENKKLRVIEKEMREAEETLKVQNKAMKEMQKKLETKDDEIEKLRDEVEDTPSTVDSSANEDVLQQIEEKNSTINQLTEKLKLVEDEKIVMLAKVDSLKNEIKVEKENQKLHSKLMEDEKNTQLAEHEATVTTLKNEIKVEKEMKENVQFELDECKCQIEKYENVLGHHKETLVDSEGIIEQLNQQLVILKTELASTEIKVFEFPEDVKVAAETQEVGVGKSTAEGGEGGSEEVAMEESAASAEIGINTSLVMNTEDAGINTSVSSSDVGCNTSLITVPKITTNEIGTNTSVRVEENSKMEDFKSPEKVTLEPLLTTPNNKKIEPQSMIGSIEGFKLDPKSTPGKYSTPSAKKFNTPSQLSKASSFST